MTEITKIDLTDNTYNDENLLVALLSPSYVDIYSQVLLEPT